MKLRTAFLLSALCVVAACKDDKGEGSAEGAETEAVQGEAKSTAFTGELTIPRLLALETILKSTSDWSEAEPELLASIGPATTSVDGTMYWAAVEGEECAYIRIDVEGTTIRLISWAKRFTREAGQSWEQCMKAAGKEVRAEASDAAPAAAPDETTHVP